MDLTTLSSKKMGYFLIVRNQILWFTKQMKMATKWLWYIVFPLSYHKSLHYFFFVILQQTVSKTFSGIELNLGMLFYPECEIKTSHKPLSFIRNHWKLHRNDVLWHSFLHFNDITDSNFLCLGFTRPKKSLLSEEAGILSK